MTWHEDDNFWSQARMRMFPQERYDAAEGEVASLVDLLQLRDGAKVLDLPCGVGVHSTALAARGFNVTAVDRTIEYLDVGRGKATARGLHIDWHEGDMREFEAPPVYDAVLNLFTSFGYFEDEVDERRAAASFRAALRPGGKLLMELMSREILCRIFRERNWQTLEDGTLFLEEHKVARNWSWLQNRWILIRDGQQQELSFGHRLYGAADLSELLQSVGFEDIQVFGSLDGAPYDHQAQRLVIVAEK